MYRNIMKIAKVTVLALILWCISAISSASAADKWDILEDRSSIKFVARYKGDEILGGFKKFSSNIIFSPQQLEKSHVKISINMSSFHTNTEDANKSLPEKEWFHTEEFPEAEFSCNNFEQVSEDEYVAHGTLTIRNNSHPVDLPFTLKIEEKDSGEYAIVSGKTEINRITFGVGANDDEVDEKVIININLTAKKL